MARATFRSILLVGALLGGLALVWTTGGSSAPEIARPTGVPPARREPSRTGPGPEGPPEASSEALLEASVATPSRSLGEVAAIEPELRAFAARSLVLHDDVEAEIEAWTAEARRLEEVYQEILGSSDDRRATVLALIAVGDLKEALGEDFERAALPAGLDPAEAADWDDALSRRATATFESSHDAWSRAAKFSEDLPPDPEIAALLAERLP